MIMTIATEKRRATSSTTAATAWDQLAELDVLAAEAAALPAMLEQAQRSAMGDVAEARAELERLYAFSAADELDVLEAQRLTKAVRAAEQAAARSWSDEIVGAQEAARRASQRCDDFLDEHFRALAEDLAARSTTVRARKLELINSLIADAEGTALGLAWERISGPLVRRPGMAPVRKRLAGFGQNTHANVLHDCAAAAQVLNEARVVLERVRQDKLLRQIPPCLDGELDNAPWGDSL